MLPDSYTSRHSRPDHFSSVKVRRDRTLIAASRGHGVYRKSGDGEWSPVQNGLPDGTAVNRLQMSDGTVFACTSRGLFRLDGERWISAEVGRPCYQYKEEWGYGFAGTGSGLLYKAAGDWKQSAFGDCIVYDFLFTPQYLYVGLDRGISMYDRLTDNWAAFELGFGITSLACTRNNLFGAGERGELVCSNGKGDFDAIRFGELFIFSVASRHGLVYVCTDRGLYRVGRLGGRLMLLSVKPGIPVADIDWHGTELYMATLSKGVQVIQTESWRPH